MGKHVPDSGIAKPTRKQLKRQIKALRIIISESYIDTADLMDRARCEGAESDVERVAWVNNLMRTAGVGQSRAQSPY